MALNLQLSYDKQDDIPEAHRELFTEQNGKWNLTGITGLKTQADVDRVQRNLEAEREAHKKTKDRLRPIQFDGHSVVEMSDDQLKGAIEALDGYDELKTKAETAGKLNEEQIAQIVESRIKTRLAPVEREKKELAEKLQAAETQVTTYQAGERRRTIHDKVREARVGAKVVDTAEPDILLLAEQMFDIAEDGRVITKEGNGVTPGITPDIWFSEMQPKRPHWWPPSEGGGARGGKGGNGTANNPWSADNWNMTAQGAYVMQHGAEKAQQMAKLAGTTLGGPKPKAKAA